jgi:hypothetical protein
MSWIDHTTTLPTPWLAALIEWAVFTTLMWAYQWWLRWLTYDGVQVHEEQPLAWDDEPPQTQPHSATPDRDAAWTEVAS